MIPVSLLASDPANPPELLSTFGGPVPPFAIRSPGGYRPVAVELVGAALVIAALAGSNLALRRQAAGRAPNRGQARAGTASIVSG